CAAAGLVWVGPPAKAMATMGNKAQAKATVAAAGVPVLPGRVVGPADDDAALSALGAEVGFPLLVKASAGGGGRGMRLVEDPSGLAESVVAARREAASTFGSDEVFLERFVPSPRHVEVQVVGDAHGSVLHLFDRECSVQRRHQKVVEEAPAAAVPDAARRVMWRAAVDAARAVGYEGVGTVEFVVWGSECAFLEMNTRLQVEHGITELVTGVDLVALQLEVAAGRPLPFAQDEVRVAGHAIEVRLCAERPRQGYRPTPGRVMHARWPEGEGLRVDAGVETGSVVSAAYDSLVAKLMATGDRRDLALARLRHALAGPLEVDGLETNRELLAAILDDPDFAAGRTATDFLGRRPELAEARLELAVRRRHAVAASVFLEHLRVGTSLVPGVPAGWRNVGTAVHTDRFGDAEEQVSVTLERAGRRLGVTVTGPGDAASVRTEVHATVTLHPPGPEDAPTGQGPRGTVDLQTGGLVVRHRLRVHGHELGVSSAEGQSSLHVAADDDAEDLVATAGECRAPLPGAVLEVLVTPGDEVADGSPLVVVEAMKMEHTLRATGAGVVREVLVEAGAQVDAGELLVLVDPA
ncbi:MAG TPA: biotin/lipoyl-containing protein, partial [Acidimicrobiales bacterium]|nr:biotin/lipoyl-containing protein [Acidimicrobiales bacterium]